MDRVVAELVTEAALESVQAKIVLPPRQLHTYVKTLAKALKKFSARAMKLRKKLEPLSKGHLRDGYEYKPLENWTLMPDGEDIWADAITDFLERLTVEKYTGTMLDYHADSALDTLKWLGEAKSPFDAQKSIGYLASDFEWVERDVFVKALDWDGLGKLAGKNWVKPTWDDYSHEYGPYKELVENKVPHIELEDLKALDALLKDFAKFRPRILEAPDRLNQIFKEKFGEFHNTEWKPETDKIETLYHATVDAKKIKARGFDKKVPVEKGLGGSQTDRCNRPAISFTSDLYVAKEVMRGLKEAVMIAKGQVRLRHVLEWADKAGVGKDVRYHTNREKYKDDPIGVMETYRHFMALQTKRYNPLFFGNMSTLMRKLKTVNVRNVGILVCQVNIDDDCVTYMSAMQEYRIAPEAVISIDKVIS